MSKKGEKGVKNVIGPEGTFTFITIPVGLYDGMD
jgi:hypothetical protein